MRNISRFCAVFAALTFSASCGGNGPTVSPTPTTPPATVMSIAVTGKDFDFGSDLDAGKCQQAVAMARFSDGTEKDMSSEAVWGSSDEAVAKVSSGLVCGVSAGTSRITAKLGTIEGGIEVKVRRPPPTAVSLVARAETTDLVLGQQPVQATARATFSDNSARDVTNEVDWISLNLTVATVSPKGLVTPVAVGKAGIRAKLGNVEGSMEVTVKEPTTIYGAVYCGSPFGARVVSGATAEIAEPASARVQTTTDSQGRYSLAVRVATFKLRVVYGQRDQNYDWTLAVGTRLEWNVLFSPPCN
ncbi:MAG: Ig-like domain-containing protein [Candidatus Doudnabacteria bacterium]|nr:Ig-like domain-containing protein [Candidatus Doudnabacteria bacterium]